MPSIHNKTNQPLAVPLPGRKKLRLGPFQAGQVAPRALEYPPLKKLIESGQIELADDGPQSGQAKHSSMRSTPGRNNSGAGGIRHVGDR